MVHRAPPGPGYRASEIGMVILHSSHLSFSALFSGIAPPVLCSRTEESWHSSAANKSSQRGREREQTPELENHKSSADDLLK